MRAHGFSYWDKMAGNKEFTSPFPTEIFLRLVPKMSRILDYGCGYGRIMELLWGLGYRNIVGVDPARELVAHGRKIYPYLDIRHNASPADEFRGHEFDVVMLIGVLTCVPDSRDQERVLLNVDTLLASGGLILLVDFLLNSDERNLKRYSRFERRYGERGVFEIDNGLVLRHHSVEHIRRLLGGFDLLHEEQGVFTTMNGNSSNGITVFGRKKAFTRPLGF
ncbi:MAG: hypothetical protein Kow00107_10030 [Planctomycetota bacterium]